MLLEREALAVPGSARQTGHGFLAGSALGARAVQLAPRLLVIVVVIRARDGVLELAHPAARRAAELGQPLRPENDQEDEEDDDDPLPTDAAGHRPTIAPGFLQTGAIPAAFGALAPQPVGGQQPLH